MKSLYYHVISLSCFIIVMILLRPYIATSQVVTNDEYWNGKETSIVRLKNQHTAKIKESTLEKELQKAYIINGRLNSNGWSVGFNYLKNRSANTFKGWSVSLNRVFHEKEIKQVNPESLYNDLGKPNSYVYGKVNDLFTLNLGYCYSVKLLPTFLNGTTDLMFQLEIGASLGMEKPYYLKLVYTDYDSNSVAKEEVKTEKYSNANSSTFLDRTKVLGSSSWTKGLREIKYIPGIYIAGEIFLLSRSNTRVIKGISFGGSAAFYSQKLKILADQKDYNYQFTLWVKVNLGLTYRL